MHLIDLHSKAKDQHEKLLANTYNEDFGVQAAHVMWHVRRGDPWRMYTFCWNDCHGRAVVLKHIVA